MPYSGEPCTISPSMYGKFVWVNPGVHDLDGLDEPEYPWSYYGDRGKGGTRGSRIDSHGEFPKKSSYLHINNVPIITGKGGHFPSWDVALSWPAEVRRGQKPKGRRQGAARAVHVSAA